jgi:hypothetical protein
MTADAVPEPASLDERRYLLARQRKWGSVLLSTAATVSVAIITAGMSVTPNWLAQREAKRAAVNAARQRNVESDRTALDIYFRYVADKPGGQPHLSDPTQLLESIASNQKMLDRLGSQQTRAVLDNRRSEAPSVAVAGLPDLKRHDPAKAYQPQDFTDYVQYADGRTDAADKVADALRTWGVRVPGTQAVGLDKSPAQNEIRIYRQAHRPAAEQLARWLQRTTGETFAVRAIGNDTLPDGIVEIWLGKAVTEGNAT